MAYVRQETLQELLEMADGDRECVRDIITEYLATGPMYVANLAQALATGSADALKLASHSFKSSSQYVGAVDLAIELAAIEKQAIAGEVQGAVDLVAQVEWLYPFVAAELQEWLRKFPIVLPGGSEYNEI